MRDVRAHRCRQRSLSGRRNQPPKAAALNIVGKIVFVGGASEDADSIELLLTANLVPAAVLLMQDTIVDWDVSASHPPTSPPHHVMFVQHLQRMCWVVHIIARLLTYSLIPHSLIRTLAPLTVRYIHP